MLIQVGAEAVFVFWARKPGGRIGYKKSPDDFLKIIQGFFYGHGTLKGPLFPVLKVMMQLV
ncbi:hypothetical protein DSLASN_31190 [Desulfoluna limicola]|uniref:Uncharacterized protein n=1 Tax=Desulfoluna limicola TaxID=2810562 RepID=A0ABM7PIU2_9BACT|nr:hypothetical protein [Desulfoluna limicola]BCS97487.1 hypothetical protein DSLASN_31190 [Desulfoluna limicola]